MADECIRASANHPRHLHRCKPYLVAAAIALIALVLIVFMDGVSTHGSSSNKNTAVNVPTQTASSGGVQVNEISTAAVEEPTVIPPLPPVVPLNEPSSTHVELPTTPVGTPKTSSTASQKPTLVSSIGSARAPLVSIALRQVFEGNGNLLLPQVSVGSCSLYGMEREGAGGVFVPVQVLRAPWRASSLSMHAHALTLAQQSCRHRGTWVRLQVHALRLANACEQLFRLPEQMSRQGCLLVV